jgi:hypothetical protein
MKKQNVFSPSFCGRKNEAFKILSSFAYSHSSLLSKQTYQIATVASSNCNLDLKLSTRVHLCKLIV